MDECWATADGDPVNPFDQDAVYACHGLDAVTVHASSGDLTGQWNEYDSESPFDRAMPRFVSQWETFIVMECAVVEVRAVFGLASTDPVTAVKRQVVLRDDVSYTVREVQRTDDGRVAELYLTVTT